MAPTCEFISKSGRKAKIMVKGDIELHSIGESYSNLAVPKEYVEELRETRGLFLDSMGLLDLVADENGTVTVDGKPVQEFIFTTRFPDTGLTINEKS